MPSDEDSNVGGLTKMLLGKYPLTITMPPTVPECDVPAVMLAMAEALEGFAVSCRLQAAHTKAGPDPEAG